MKKKLASKRLLSLLLTFVMVLSLFPATAFAAQETETDSRTVYLTVSINGAFCKDKDGKLMAQRELAVPVKEDGSLTIDDIMRYAHQQLSPKGAEDYASDGINATRLWGADKGDNAILFGIDKTGGSSLVENVTYGTNPNEIPEAAEIHLTAAFYKDTASARTARFVGEPPQYQSISRGTLATQAILMKNTEFSINLVCSSVKSSTASALKNYKAVAYKMDGTPVEIESTISSGSNSNMKIKFSEAGTYVLSAKPGESATVTGVSAPACIVTVLDAPIEYSAFQLYADSDRTLPLTVEKSESADGEAATYTVAVPEDVATIYPVFDLSQYADRLNWQIAMLSNGNWVRSSSNGWTAFGNKGSIPVGTLSSGYRKSELQIHLLHTWNYPSSIQYNRLIIKSVPTLSSISVEGYDRNTFDPKGFDPYSVYINGDAESIAITPVSRNTEATITVGSVETKSGETVKLPLSSLSFDSNNQAKVQVTVSATGDQYMGNGIYTILLDKQPQLDTPTLLFQSEGADYIQGDQAKPLSLYASANGPMSYQWYRNGADNAENGEAIGGADEGSFTPPTTDTSDYYFYCVVTNKNTSKSVSSNPVHIVVDPDPTPAIEWDVEVPDVSTEHKSLFGEYTKGFYYIAGEQNPTPLKVKASSAAAGGDWSYLWTIRTGSSTEIRPETEELQPGTDKEYGLCTLWCDVTYTFKDKEYTASLYDDPVMVYVDKPAVAYPVGVWDGDGTVESPWKLNRQSDLEKVREYAAQGLSFADKHLKMMQDITLDNNWDSIGALKDSAKGPANGANINPFSGTLDGGGHTLTYAEGIAKPLFRYVREAAVRNMNIYAPNFKGALLVSDYVVDYGEDGDYSIGTGGSYTPGCPDTIDIENITVKSGTCMKGSTFIDGGASGGNIVNIRNCKIESGVTMGKDKATGELSGSVASFAGRISGTVVNCVSYADLYSNGGASGIVSGKSQSMGPFLVVNCGFLGSITAQGSYVGGIMGNGYGAESAPNTPCVTIQNCYVAADLKGADKIGGIYGGEPLSIQNWAPAYIRNNHFSGTIMATAANADVGGVVGYMHSLNRNNVIENNFYNEDCGASRAVGNAKYVDTSGTHETASGATYFNTANARPDISGVSKDNLNRTDDPLGKDAANLGKPVTKTQMADGTVTALLNKGEGSLKNWVQGKSYPIVSADPVAYGLTLSGNYKTEYHVGDSFSTAGMVITALYSDGSTKALPSSDVTFAGFDSSKRGVQTIQVKYDGAVAEFTVRVLVPETSEITVSFTLLGDDVHDSDKDKAVHTLAAGNLQTWIVKKFFTVSPNATVREVLEQALREANMTWENTSGNYVQSITRNGVKLGEFTNGKNTGWMYTLNGTHPLFGVNEQYLNNGDSIIFHYTDDYTKEEGSEKWNDGSGSTPGGGSKIEPETVVSGNTATVSIPEKSVTSAIEAVQKSGEKTITIAPKNTGSAKNIDVTIPKTAAKSVVDGTKAAVKIETGSGSVTIPNETLASIVKQASGDDVKISVEKKTAADIADETIDAKNAVIAAITVASNGKAITSFGGESLTVGIPVDSGYTAGQSYKVIILSADGTKETTSGKCVSADGKLTVEVSTKHLSTFIVTKEKTQRHTFADVKEGSWYYDAVQYAVSNGLFQGYSDTAFAPDDAMTRAMLVTVLYRMDKSPAVSGTSTFADVKAGQWYTNAVLWAQQNKLVTGYNDTTFGTDDSVSREQMAAILYRYAQSKKYDVSVGKDTNLLSYTDTAGVSEYAMPAMQWACGAKLINGSDEKLMPQGDAQRAQVAAILMRWAQNVAK